jgi:hypothetical protein
MLSLLVVASPFAAASLGDVGAFAPSKLSPRFAALKADSPGTMYGIIIDNGKVPVKMKTVTVTDGVETNMSQSAWPSGGVGQATGTVVGDHMYLMTGQLMPDGTTLSYRVEDHDLATGRKQAIYTVPVPDMPAQYTMFGIQFGVDMTLGKAGTAVVFAPTNSSQFSPPFDYSLFAVDFATNTSKVLTSWKKTSTTTGVSPIFEGYPATVDTKRHVFWTITGLFNSEGEAVRTLIGVDMTTGEVVGSHFLGSPPSLTLISYDAKYDALWGAGYSDAPSTHGNTLAIVSMDVTTGKYLSMKAFPEVGTAWNANVLPGIVAFDSYNQQLVFPVASFAQPSGLNNVSLATLPVSAGGGDGGGAPAHVFSNFCHLANFKTGEMMTCPKMMAWAPSAASKSVH